MCRNQIQTLLNKNFTLGEGVEEICSITDIYDSGKPCFSNLLKATKTPDYVYYRTRNRFKNRMFIFFGSSDGN